ncbi:coiled-coil domain-containing protein 175-like isoform X3 [Coturnix japonica]|uniref:coiled-coil domain-containing protein 175-like isoform X3 n=1 Tax=Coturnix japonica TaxID=93934 RepID=UPI000776DC66|nr:coiled-coil domain-containing protein 175-like isoform X3 [Coturnix japonica]
MLRPEAGAVALPPSAVAVAAIHRLQSLEKYVKNEDCVFNGEIVQHLEDTIAAIKKLEEMRRNTIECLEEETIKNSKLRFRLHSLPREIAAEMAALVAASRESGAVKMNQLQSALKNIAYEIDLLEKKQALCERQNAALCEEQKRLKKQHKERVHLLNERMATRISTNVLLLETDRRTRAIERELISAKAALEELQAKIAERMSQLEKEMEECDEKNREMKKILDAQKEKTSAKQREFENLNVKLSDLQHLINLNSTAIHNEKILIAELKEKREHLEKKMDLNKADMVAAVEKKNQVDSEFLLLQSQIVQEKEDFDQELGKVNEYLQNVECLNNKLKLENKAVRQKFERALEEEQYWARKRNEMDTKTTKENNAKELASLEQNLEAENKMRVMLQWRLLLYLAMQSKLLEEENISRKRNERIEAGEKRKAELLKETKELEKEILRSENQIKALTEEARKKKNDYKSYNEDFTNKIKHLEDDIKTASENLLKIEEKLKASMLTLEETQKERDEKHTEYEELRKSFLKKKDEELQIQRAIEKSIKTTGTLKEEILELQKQLQIKRDAAVSQMKHQTESMKLLERDIYEINRKLDIVNIENCRFKSCNAQMKEDILAMNAEAEVHQSTIVKIQNDLAMLRGLLLERWAEDSSIQKEFLENEQEILNALAALVRKIQHREEKIGDINSRVRDSLEGLDALFEKKARMDNDDAVKNK